MSRSKAKGKSAAAAFTLTCSFPFNKIADMASKKSFTYPMN